MIYIKSILAGTVLLIACVAQLNFALAAIFLLDLRAIMGLHPLISLPTMVAIFAIGFMWPLRRASKRRAPPRRSSFKAFR
jgi:hypothetical protein